MDVQDGFIVGIFNYCDRWCERCRFTSRCGLFADAARHEAATDPTFKALADTPPHPSDVRETPGWLEDLLEEANGAVSIDEQPLPESAPLPPHHREVIARAMAYGDRVFAWLDATRTRHTADHGDPIAAIAHFSYHIGAKVRRALTGLAEFDGDRSYPPDHEGSAKVALVAMEESLTAWRDLVAIGRIDDADAATFIDDLHWLRLELDRAIPLARAFVRPGFDEPDDVRRLEASGA